MENKTEDYKQKIASIIKDNRIDKEITGLVMLTDNTKGNNSNIHIIGENDKLLSFVIDAISKDKKTCDLFLNAVFNFFINYGIVEEEITRTIFKDDFINRIREGFNYVNNIKNE